MANSWDILVKGSHVLQHFGVQHFMKTINVCVGIFSLFVNPMLEKNLLLLSNVWNFCLYCTMNSFENCHGVDCAASVFCLWSRTNSRCCGSSCLSLSEFIGIAILVNPQVWSCAWSAGTNLKSFLLPLSVSCVGSPHFFEKCVTGLTGTSHFSTSLQLLCLTLLLGASMGFIGEMSKNHLGYFFSESKWREMRAECVGWFQDL